jgi:DNA-binding LytR/AlgR family response regulator
MESRITVLIVEDDPLLAEDIQQNLQKEGMAVAGIAENLAEAVEIMKRNTVELALIDMQLNGPEDGVTTASELLKIKWIPIIYMTATAPLEVKERMEKTYPSAFLAKPLRLKEVAVQIRLAMLNFKAGNLPAPQQTKASPLFLPTDKGHINVKIKEIMYMKAKGNNAELFLSEEEFVKMYPKKKYEPVLILANMGSIFRQLSPDFYRLSRFITVNLNHVSRIDSHRLFIQDHEITIPEGRRKDLMAQLVIVKSK